jgi:hypothetical protein
MINSTHFFNAALGILIDPFNLLGCALIGYASKKSFEVFLWCILWAAPVLILGNSSNSPEMRMLGNGISYLMIVFIDTILICGLRGLFRRKKEVKNDSIEDEVAHELEENMSETGQNKSYFNDENEKETHFENKIEDLDQNKKSSLFDLLIRLAIIPTIITAKIMLDDMRKYSTVEKWLFVVGFVVFVVILICFIKYLRREINESINIKGLIFFPIIGILIFLIFSTNYFGRHIRGSEVVWFLTLWGIVFGGVLIFSIKNLKSAEQKVKIFGAIYVPTLIIAFSFPILNLLSREFKPGETGYYFIWLIIILAIMIFENKIYSKNFEKQK